MASMMRPSFAGCPRASVAQRCAVRPSLMALPKTRPVVLASAAVDAAAAAVSEAVEVSGQTKAVQVVDTKENFDALIADAAKANDLVVVDYYTQWCGPCKMIAPKIEELAQEMKGKGVRFAKVDCGKDDASKKWAMSIGIKVLPTFRFYKDGNTEHCDQVTGSKVEQVVAAVEKNKTK